MNTGIKIKNIRSMKKLTLQEIGDYVGVGASTVRKWETGNIATIRSDKLHRLAECLGTTVEFLLATDGPTISIDSMGSNNGVIGSNLGTVNAGGSLSKEEAELLRIFSGLDVRKRMELLSVALRLEEESQ